MNCQIFILCMAKWSSYSRYNCTISEEYLQLKLHSHLLCAPPKTNTKMTHVNKNLDYVLLGLHIHEIQIICNWFEFANCLMVITCFISKWASQKKFPFRIYLPRSEFQTQNSLAWMRHKTNICSEKFIISTCKPQNEPPSKTNWNVHFGWRNLAEGSDFQAHHISNMLATMSQKQVSSLTSELRLIWGVCEYVYVQE